MISLPLHIIEKSANRKKRKTWDPGKILDFINGNRQLVLRDVVDVVADFHY